MKSNSSDVTVYVDTALSALYLCVEKADGCVAEYKDGELRASDSLHQKLLELLKNISASVDDITHLVIVRGPGSFTGLRVAYAFVEALKMTHPRLTVHAVDALEAFLQTYATSISSDIKEVLVMTDAYGGQCFYQKFVRNQKEQSWNSLTSAVCMPLDSVELKQESFCMTSIDLDFSESYGFVTQGIDIKGIKMSAYHKDYAPVYIKPLTYKKMES